jgi:glycosyltransferase involved in cell wall biosynthesis
VVTILVVAPQPFFTPRGTPFSVYYRTLVTCSLGHKADLLTYGQGDDVDIPGCTIHRIPAFRWLGPVRIGPSLQKLFLDFFMAIWTIGFLLRRRYEVVHAHEEAVFWCRWLKPFFRYKLIYDMHSSLPQQLHNFQFTKLRAVHWAFEKLETSAVKAAEAVITICPALRDYARSLTEDHRKVLLIENSLFDPVRFVAANPNPGTLDRNEKIGRTAAIERWLDMRDRTQIISYAGTLEVYQGIDRLLEAFSVVARQMPDAGLLIIGGLEREVEQLRAHAGWLELGNAVYFTGQVPQPEAQQLVANSVASVSPRFAGNNTPMKIYALMGAGIPLIATRIESHTQVLNDDISFLADVSTGALAEEMIRVLIFPDGARETAARARAWYEEHYSRDAYTAKMRQLFSLVT